MKHALHQVEVWEESVIIPTYEVGEPDANPMFLEKRVYQGSSGKVYPLPVIDKIKDEKADKAYRAVWLENGYLRIMLLPELGGRVQRAYDKTNGYDFVYYNEVIKPALVGLTGPWISGGIEFNWPQHHRPSTYSPTDYLLLDNGDGSKTVQINDVDAMYGTKSIASFTLYPDKAYLEIKGQLYNRTPLPQTFLWWANPAVAVNDNTQSIFPPDVHAVMDHGKRAVSRFPIATGVYYKHDYGEGVDISRYKNIPVPTSYMAYHSDYNFVGGYDYDVEAGVLHIADHHVSPGKKQWTWGCGDFGRAWDRNLTDENGPYIELMTGVYTDNQPDFTWLKPFEEKAFTQYFMPYKQVGGVSNASTEAVLRLEKVGKAAELCVYATARYENARILLTRGTETLYTYEGVLSPNDICRASVPCGDTEESGLRISVYDGQRLMLDYQPRPRQVEKIPEPAQAAPEPAQIATNEELYLTAMHLEQYRHATYEPDAYYLEGLKRDPLDSRINNAYGMLLLRRGLFEQAEMCLRRAIQRLTFRNPNPYDSEPYYNLGLALLYQGRCDAAFDAFYKATWTAAQQEMAFYYLACIARRKGCAEDALQFVERSLTRNTRNVKARGLKGVILEALGRKDEAVAWYKENLLVDRFDYVSRVGLDVLTGSDGRETEALLRGEVNSYLCLARDLQEMDCHARALAALSRCGKDQPMLRYYAAYSYAYLGDRENAERELALAAKAPPLYCFPNSLEDIAVLTLAMELNPMDSKAPYYLANLFYDRKRCKEAQTLWEKSVQLNGNYPTAHRNLALAYFNKANQPERALASLTRAFMLDTADARVLLELDQLHKKLGLEPAKRLDFLGQYRQTAEKRDDIMVEIATLLNLLDRPEEAYRLIMGRTFHPWEGGEGKVTGQYTISLLRMAQKHIALEEYEAAEEYLKKALTFPKHLGEGKLEGTKDNNIYYYLGCVCAAMGRAKEADRYWKLATLGSSELAGAMYYNDQPADLILYQGLAFERLGDAAAAKTRYHRLLDYGEAHLFDEVKIEYFAVSLPDLQLFEDNLTDRNRLHCQYLIALGSHGMGDLERAREMYDLVLKKEPAHLGAHIHRALLA